MRLMTGAAVSRWRATGGACLAHFLHDGCGEMLYVLLPFWQRELVLSFTQVGMLKTLYSAALAGGQIPAGRLGERWGERGLLIAGTLLMASAVLMFHFAAGPVALGLLLVLSGLGGSVQHPLASALIARNYGGAARRHVLGTYNFTGDLGKVTITVMITLLTSQFGWRGATQAAGILAVVTALVLFVVLAPTRGGLAQQSGSGAPVGRSKVPEPIRRRGFMVLSVIGFLDSAGRAGLLTFMPFLLARKGASPAELGVAVSLVFGGGAAGKYICGAFGARIGLLRTVAMTEVGTILSALLLLVLPLWPCIVLTPLIGVVLNGTSSILYGTVPELALPDREARAFGIFYTLTIGAGAVAPTFYGAVGDALGINASIILVAAIVLLVLPLVGLLRPALNPREALASEPVS
jgi:MFS transporter, FSR family, fosmidomycin resistance protein